MNEKEYNLAPNERLVTSYRCPECGGTLIENYGPGISVTFCERCGWNQYDYSEILDDYDLDEFDL